MSSSKPAPRFLLDENVRIDLYRFLKARAVDVELISKSTSDSNVALKSKDEGRVLVTNDRDFCKYDKNEIFSVVWLRISQKDSVSLTRSFSAMLDSLEDFSGKFIVLASNSWREFLLGEVEEVEL